MNRSVLFGGLLVLAVAVPLAAAPVPPAEDRPPSTLAAKLKQPIKFEGLDADPKYPLQEALDHLQDRYDLAFRVNEAAFKAEMVEDVLATPIAEKAIPKMSNAPLETVLRRILERIPSASGATFLLRRDAIEITTTRALRDEVWGPTFQGPFLPLVTTTLDKQPLAEALRELADSTDFAVVLDSKVGDKARTVVSGRFINTPLDTTVRLLADSAELRSFLVDNVLYVTTPENAARLESEEKKQVRQARKDLEQQMKELGGATAPGPRVGAGRYAPRSPEGGPPGM